MNVFWAGVLAAYHHAQFGDLVRAQRAIDAVMATSEGTGFPWSTGAGHRMLAQVLVLQHGWAAAPHYRAAVDHTFGVGDIEGSAVSLRSAAGAAKFVGDEDLATGLWNTVPGLRGRPLVQNMFYDQEQQLLAVLGPPAPSSISALVGAARTLLGPGPETQATSASASSSFAAADPIALLAGGEQTVQFGDYQLDLALCELRCSGERVHGEPQVLDVLACLVARRGVRCCQA